MRGERTFTHSQSTNLWMMRNLQVSFAHSCLSSCLLVFTILHNREMFSDPVSYASSTMYAQVALSCGYFVYDFCDVSIWRKLKDCWIVLAHHIIIVCMFTYNLAFNYCLYYLIIGLTMEINSIFLHSRKLLKLYGYKKTIAFKVNAVLNFVSFILFRFAALGFMLYDLCSTKNPALTLKYFYAFLFGGILIGLLNIGLFFKLVLSDFCPPTHKYEERQVIEVRRNFEKKSV